MRRSQKRADRLLRSRGLTVIEILIIVTVIAVLIAILLPALKPHRRTTYQLKDRTQIRGIMQGMVIFAQQHDDKFPVPSELDPDNTTVAAPGVRKDTTANIYSKLMFDAYFTPELMFSPEETNGAIMEDTDYEWDAPSTAVDPERALWDPAFRADFTDPENPGNTSYAHMLPHGKRIARWHSTFKATDPVLSNRGPEVRSIEWDSDRLDATLANPKSNTLGFHGSRTEWSGLIGYNDNHVDLEESMAPNSVVYTFGGEPRRDVLFFDEPDDPDGANAFLSIFVDPGEGAERQRAIWD